MFNKIIYKKALTFASGVVLASLVSTEGNAVKTENTKNSQESKEVPGRSIPSYLTWVRRNNLKKKKSVFLTNHFFLDF